MADSTESPKGGRDTDEFEVVLKRDCHGGEKVVEILLPRGLTVADVDRLDAVTSRTVLDHLPKPFIRIDVAGQYLLTGIGGDRRVRFVVRRAVSERAVDVAMAAAASLMGCDS